MSIQIAQEFVSVQPLLSSSVAGLTFDTIFPLLNILASTAHFIFSLPLIVFMKEI